MSTGPSPSPDLGRTIAANHRPVRRLAVSAGCEGWKKTQAVETDLARLVTQTDGSYIGQAPESMLQLTRGCAHEMKIGDLTMCRDHIRPDLSFEEFSTWGRRYGQVFWDVPGWMEHCRRFDMVIGPRIHGTILALQAGIPAICLVIDSRTLELCQLMKIPYILAKDFKRGMNPSELYELFQFDPVEFDTNRRNLCKRYISFLESNKLPYSSYLDKIANSFA